MVSDADKIKVIESVLGEWVNVRDTDNPPATWTIRKTTKATLKNHENYAYEGGTRNRIEPTDLHEAYTWATGLLNDDHPRKKWMRIEDFNAGKHPNPVIITADQRLIKRFINWCENTS